MVKVTVTDYFPNYTEKAISQIVETCKGKPAYGSDGKVKIGTIVGCKLAPNNGVEFAIKIEVI